MGKSLSDLLRNHLDARQMSPKKLAAVTGLPSSTVHRWAGGGNATVHEWQDIAKIARALGLDRAQTSELLRAAGQPPLVVLDRWGLEPDDRALLATWPNHLPASNLPVRLSRFIGRAQERADLTALLDDERLVTITGSGGTGKTRLALEVARALEPTVDGAYFVDLAGLREPDRVLPAIAEAVGSPATTVEPVFPALAAHVQGYRVLLVLDNLEHLLEAGPQIVALQQAVPTVTVLVTSRVCLHVRGECDYAVDPLPLPVVAGSYRDLANNPAVALFADRARNANRHFGLTAENAPIVASICESLEGLPLAIELAAARIRELPLSRMQEQLSSRLDLASDGPRDADPRQSTMRATVAWSYSLLDERAQRWFRLISVFAGGFTREAMAAVGETAQLDAEDVTPGLLTLVAHQLVRRVRSSADEVPRYTMLETIREFASEQLVASGSSDAARAAHAAWFLGLAECADFSGPQQAAWYGRLGVERDNIRAALDWCRDRGHYEMGLRLVLAMMPYWEQRNLAQDSLAWVTSFMVDRGAVKSVLWARGLAHQADLALSESRDPAAVLRVFEESLAIVRAEGDLALESEVVRVMADAHVHWHEQELAHQQYRESLDIAMRTGDARLIALAHMGLAYTSDFEEAESAWEQTLAWAQRSGRRETIAKATNSLGEFARFREDWDVAAQHYGMVLATGEELQSEFLIALASHNLGYVAIGRGDLIQATAYFTESLRRYLSLQSRKGMADCLAGLARVAALDGRFNSAACLCGAVEALLDAAATGLDTLDLADYQRTLATLHERLGPELDARHAIGRAMPLDEAIRYALDPSSGSTQPD